MAERAHGQSLPLKRRRGGSSVETVGRGRSKNTRGLKQENKKQETVHIKQIETSKLGARSFTKSSGLGARGVGMVWKSPHGDCAREPRTQDYMCSRRAGFQSET